MPEVIDRPHRRPARLPEGVERRAVFAEVPLPLYLALRRAAAEEDRTIRAIVEELLRDYLNMAA